MFFECNLPKKAPAHILSRLHKPYEEVVARIYERTEKLNNALDLSGMKPETFQVLSSELFKREEKIYGNVDHFDGMTDMGLAAYVNSVFVQDEQEDRIDWNNTIVLFDTAFATTKEWELLRHIGIGGSDASVIEGTSKYVTKQGVYNDKIGKPVKLNTEEDKGFIFARGHFLEDTVIEYFCKTTGAVRIRDTRMFRSITHPHCIADIDAIIRMPDNSIYCFEAKTTVTANKKAWEKGKVPPYYVTQTHHYPAVLADERVKGTYIGCLFTVDFELGGDYVGSQFNGSKALYRLVERDATEEQEILDRNEEFWNTYIEMHTEPEPSKNPELDLNTIRKYSGTADPSLPVMDLTTPQNLDLGKQYMELSDKISKLEKKIKNLDEERANLKTQFCDMLGQHVEGQIRIDSDTFYEVKYSPSKKTSCDYDKLEACYPEVYEQVVTVNPEGSRKFTVKKKTVKKKKTKTP